MANKDYSKYNVKGLGENLNKRKLVFSVVKDWVGKNKPSFEELQKVFPDEVQGSKGFIRKESDVKDAKRFNMREPLTIKNGVHVVVSNQWGKNIGAFIEIAQQLGYNITTIEPEQSGATQNAAGSKIIDVSAFDLWQLTSYFESVEGDESVLDEIDEEIERLLDDSPKYFIVGKLFEKYGYEYFRHEVYEYFSLAEDEDDLLDLLRDESLLSILIKKENLSDSVISPENTDFALYFAGYFIHALELLIQIDDNALIAEFIIKQSASTIEDEFNVEWSGGDWLSDLTLGLVEYVYGYDVTQYEGECEIDGYYLGQYNSMGYDFLTYAQDVIDANI